MLLLHDTPHRLSIDIDIMCPPGTDIEQYLASYADCGFIDYKLVERKQAGTDVPKSHSKFFYQVAFKADMDRTSYILLDVLYVKTHINKMLALVDIPALKLLSQRITKDVNLVEHTNCVYEEVIE